MNSGVPPTKAEAWWPARCPGRGHGEKHCRLAWHAAAEGPACRYRGRPGVQTAPQSGRLAGLAAFGAVSPPVLPLALLACSRGQAGAGHM